MKLAAVALAVILVAATSAAVQRRRGKLDAEALEACLALYRRTFFTSAAQLAERVPV